MMQAAVTALQPDGPAFFDPTAHFLRNGDHYEIKK